MIGSLPVENVCGFVLVVKNCSASSSASMHPNVCLVLAAWAPHLQAIELATIVRTPPTAASRRVIIPPSLTKVRKTFTSIAVWTTLLVRSTLQVGLATQPLEHANSLHPLVFIGVGFI